MYKYLSTISLSLIFLNSCASSTNINKQKETITYQKQFNSIWNIVKSDPYKELPQNEVSYFSLSKDDKSQILEDAKRTIKSKEDILPYFDKLAHPNGICFKGTWNITKDNIYTGYFKKNSKALIIARASSALSNTKTEETRTFGFAGKIFPTTNPNKIINKNTANFFLIDDLGGTKINYYANTTLSNAPEISFNYEVLKNLFYALKLKDAFERADKNPNIRQVYEISELNETKNIKTPKYMKIKARYILNKNASDFRDELSISSKDLIFDIFVSEDKKNWNNIGNIILDESVVSESCDHRLHFSHPKYKSLD
jgi:hypothetical protein